MSKESQQLKKIFEIASHQLDCILQSSNSTNSHTVIFIPVIINQSFNLEKNPARKKIEFQIICEAGAYLIQWINLFIPPYLPAIWEPIKHFLKI